MNKVVYLDFKEARCKNCYKCLKECPVKAIRIENNQAKIIEKRCILCGHCTLICPQNAKLVRSDIDYVLSLLKKDKVIASVAPSFISNFEIDSFTAFEEGLKKLGFVSAEETARGAKAVTEKYSQLLDSGEYKNLISSCCPSINQMIQLYYPDALKYLAPVDSPVIAHGKMLKNEYPDHKIVFIGPCLSKKKECHDSGVIDAVLTFEEIDILFKENGIELKEENVSEDASYNKARLYPINRGIIKSFTKHNDNYVYISVDGTNRAMKALEEINDLDHIFLEINSCQSSCIGGPCRVDYNHNFITANAKIREDVSKRNNIEEKESSVDIIHNFEDKYIDEEVKEDRIIEILNKTGKYKPEDELNCGACGYNTCRQKAWAVLNGYADINMCLPYMRGKAENISYEMMKSSPYGIIVIDNKSLISDINKKAKDLLKISSINNNEESIMSYCADTSIMEAIVNKQNIFDRRIEIDDSTYADYSLTYIKQQDVFLMIMKDVSSKVNYLNELEKVKDDTIAITDEVVKKQMRVVQQIASLLGETTAETKVALNSLKKYLRESSDK